MQTKARILIVDDEKIILKAYPLELAAAGYEVFTASTGAEALALIDRERVDIVYVDYTMPDMNGVTVCQKIKMRSPDTEVVLISGHRQDAEYLSSRMEEAGGRKKVLIKPLQENELTEMTDTIRQQQKDQQEQ